jgi:hypothetical protein
MGIQPVYGERGSVILSEFIINSGNIHALLPHVPGSFFGEGEREYPGWVDVFLFDHVCYFCCDGRGLACACKDQLGGLGVFYGFKLAGF